MGKEALTASDIDDIIEINHTIMARRDNIFSADRELLETIAKELDQFRSIKDRRKRVLSMAAWLMYRMVEGDTFHDGRKSTAIPAGVRFLNTNGFDLLVELLPIKQALFDLLNQAQKHRADFEDIRAFLDKKAINPFR